MKTSKKDFEIFKKEFMRWVEIFGLKGHHLNFRLEPLRTNNSDSFRYAEIDICEEGKWANVTLNINQNGSNKTRVKQHAKHEAIHLLIHKIGWIGKCRYLNDGEIDNEDERLVRILEKVL